uniref:Uncharacterized protein n=1 Tax=Tolypothrix bouteillei VB521301 TaxID=1479485 RepID=A0A0C1MVM9_9CYAN
MATQTCSIPHYDLDFKYNSEGSDLEIYNSEGDLIACFVGDRAIKLFTLLMTFPTVNERDYYINARLTELINLDF